MMEITLGYIPIRVWNQRNSQGFEGEQSRAQRLQVGVSSAAPR